MGDGGAGGPGGHSHDGPAQPVPPRTRVLLLLALTPFLLLTVIGAVLLWPAQRSFPTPPQFQSSSGAPVAYVKATTTAVTPARCGPKSTASGCLLASFKLSSGQQATVILARGPGQPSVHAGDRVVLARTADEAGRTVYYFDDFARGSPLTALFCVFALLAIVVGRRRGLAALIGLAVAFLALVEFLLPALLSGSNPLLVALVTGSGVMVLVLYIGHGVSARTTVAVLGTLTGLLLVGVIGVLAVGGTQLTGLSSDDLTAVQSTAGGIDVTGLLLAGLIIGSLGVLNDVTVTQASAVWELHHANPEMGRRRLYGAAMRIGRDHIASTIYTLLLAYAGAALPVLLLFTLASEPLGVVLNGDLVASDVVRSLVGGIGLLLTVPLTTLIGVLTVAQPAGAAQAAVFKRPAEPRPAVRTPLPPTTGNSWSRRA